MASKLEDATEPSQKGLFRHDNSTPAEDIGILNLFLNKGKTAIISGGGGGIGYEVARALAASGCNVAIWYNTNKKAIERAADLEKQYNVRARAYSVNVTEPEEVQKAVDEIVDEFNGRLDIFIANAGIPWKYGPMVDGPLDRYTQLVNSDLNGCYYCARAAAKHWRRQKAEGTTTKGEKLAGFRAGSFVATASMSGHIVNYPQLQASYNASKAGVIHLCRSLAVEWARFARANSVSPGYTATEISNFIPQETQNYWNDKTPLGRPCQPHELQGAYLYLASEASSYTTGIDVTVDGGYCAV